MSSNLTLNLTNCRVHAKATTQFFQKQMAILMQACKTRRRKVARLANTIRPLIKNFKQVKPVLDFQDSDRQQLKHALDDLDDTLTMLRIKDCDLCKLNNQVNVGCIDTHPLSCCKKHICRGCISQLVANSVKVYQTGPTFSVYLSVEYACPFCRGPFFQRVLTHSFEVVTPDHERAHVA